MRLILQLLTTLKPDAFPRLHPRLERLPDLELLLDLFQVLIVFLAPLHIIVDLPDADLEKLLFVDLVQLLDELPLDYVVLHDFLRVNVMKSLLGLERK